MTITSYLPFTAVMIPLFCACLLPFVADEKTHQLTAIAGFGSLVVTLLMYPQIGAGNNYLTVLDTDFQTPFLFRVDALSFIVGLIASLLWGLSSMFSIEYMRKEKSLKRYNLFSLLSFCGMMGVVFTGNLFSLYMFFELLSIASYVMFIHRETDEAKSAGLTYIFLGIGGGLILLLSIIATYAITGTGDLSLIGMGLRGHPALPYIVAGYVMGFGVKAGLFPLYIWMPKAYAASPSPTAAISSGVMIKAGAYGIIRTIISIVGVEGMKGEKITFILLFIAFINIFIGSAVAIKQKELKKMLAYSSVSQIGYIILGAVLFSPLGLMGGVVHIFNHAFTKGTLFLCAGAFIHKTGKKYLVDLKGIGRRMPLTTVFFTMAALSMIGIPPFTGFISKWYLVTGALEISKSGSHQAGIGMIAMSILLLSSFMNLVYYGPVVVKAWFKSDAETETVIQGNKSDDPNWWMMIPILILGVGTLFFGLFPQFPLGIAQQVSTTYIP